MARRVGSKAIGIVTLVGLFGACAFFGNTAPVIGSFTADPEFLPAGEQTTLTVEAIDPESDPLSFKYDVVSGDATVAGDGSVATATVGSEATSVVQVTVSDNHGGETIKTLTLVIANQAPVISSFAADSPAIGKGGNTSLAVDAGDPDGDLLTYSYELLPPAPGCTLGGSTTSVETFHAPDTNGTATVQVTVSDGNGGQAVAKLQIQFATYTVRYSSNSASGGTVPTSSAQYSAGSTATVAGNSGGLYKGESTFDRWNTASDGSGVTYWPGDTFAVEADVTLFAQWMYTDTSNLSLRDTGPAGGLIFYVNPNANSDGWKYLEAAPASTEWTSRSWGQRGAFVGAFSYSLGAGEPNSELIAAHAGTAADDAAALCLGLTYGGHSDWFLPSRDELSRIMWNLVGIRYESGSGTLANSDVPNPLGGFGSAVYWTSTEYGSDDAYKGSMSSGRIYGSDKSWTNCVRAVRAF